MGSATTGWFNAGSSPTVETKCDVSLSKSGTTVTVNWAVYMRLASSQSYLGSGSLDVYCGCSGASDARTIKDHNSSWSGTGEHSASGSFTFDSGSTGAQTFEINFWSDSDYFSSSGIFDQYIQCSVDASVTTPTVTCSITGKTSSSISASMTVTNDGGASIVDRYIDLFSNAACTNKVGTITGASGTFTGLSANTTYYARANASNGTYRGYSSVQSNTTYQKTIPTISLSSKSSSSITVTSGCNVSVSSTQYRIKPANGSYGAYQSSGTFTGLSANTAYVVEVKKVGQASGEAGTATLSVTTYQRTIPTISLSSKTVNSVTVTSGCNVTASSTQYRIKPASGSYGGYQNSATFSGLSPNTSYVVEVKKVGQASGEAGTATLNVTTYQIGEISSAANFVHGDNSSLVVTNPSSASLSLAMKIGNTQIFSKSVSAGTITNIFTDEQLDNIYKLYGTNSSLTVTYILTTTANGSSYTNNKTCTITFTGNQKTGHINVGGTWKRTKRWINVGGTWKRCVRWINVDGTWKRCI